MSALARYTAAVALGALSLCAGDDTHPKGVHPRATPDDYAIKASGKNAIFAASLVPAEEAKHLFAFDITGKFLIFEVAYFPHENEPPALLDVDDFVIKHSDKGALTHGADATSVASSIQKDSAPRELPSRMGDTQVMTEAHVGYESGPRDPVTGQKTSGVYTGGGVAVEHGGPTPPADYPKPGASPEDRRLLVTQLADRQFPSGKFDHPVAGYLYFPRSLVKKDKDGNFLLEHLGETNGAGMSETVQLVIPGKTR